MGGGLWKVLQKSKFRCNADVVGVLAIIISVIIMLISIAQNSEWFSVVIWYVPAALLISYAICDTKLSNVIFTNHVVRLMGDISFEFFLIHQLCIRYVAVITNRLGISAVPIVVAINLCVSIIATLIWRKLYFDIKTRINRR